jgi:hypothetical protein
MKAPYQNCPKCKAESGGADTCPACGLIFAKYLQARVAVPAKRVQATEDEDESSLVTRAKALAFYVPEEVNAMAVYGRAALLLGAALYGCHLALMDIPEWEMSQSFMHLALLPFHEFGHILFRPFGEFMMLLGGSLFQVMLPLILGAVFIVRNRDPFAGSLMLWWAAAGVMDTAPYIYDAWKPQHVLLTGRTGDTGAHDFIDVLGDLGLLHRAQPIGRAVHAFSVALMLAALAWGAWLVRAQYAKRSAF